MHKERLLALARISQLHFTRGKGGYRGAIKSTLKKSSCITTDMISDRLIVLDSSSTARSTDWLRSVTACFTSTAYFDRLLCLAANAGPVWWRRTESGCLFRVGVVVVVVVVVVIVVRKSVEQRRALSRERVS